MTDLTEKWKKGILPCGWYYIKIADIVFIDFFEGKAWKNKKDKYIDKILAPVPCYDEWEKLNWYAGNGVEENQELKMENAKLKELLKECKEPLEVLAEKRDACDWYPEDVLAKLYQALGDKNNDEI